MDNPEGQVTYPIRNRTAGLPTSSSTFLGVHCVFIFVFIIKPYGTINLIRQIQILASIYFRSYNKVLYQNSRYFSTTNKWHPSISAECHQILFLYSYFKSVLEYKPYIIFCFHYRFLYKAAPNPDIELVGYAILLFQGASEPFEQSLFSFFYFQSVLQ